MPGQQFPPRGHHQHSFADSDRLSSPGQPPTIARLEQCRLPACLPACGLLIPDCSPLLPLKFNDRHPPPTCIQTASSVLSSHLDPPSTCSLLKNPHWREKRPCSPRLSQRLAPPDSPANAGMPCTGQGESASKLDKRAGSGGLLLTHSEGLSQPPTVCHFASSL